jgi:hypothetical protein
VLIGNRMQNPRCEPCRITASRLDRPPYSVRFDLTPAYTFGEERLAARVKREIALDPSTHEIRIRDTIVEPVETVRWQCMVDVEPRLQGGRAVLARDGQAVEMVMSPATAVWMTKPATPPTPRERQNKGFQLLAAEFAVPAAGSPLAIEVVIRPAPGL